MLIFSVFCIPLYYDHNTLKQEYEWALEMSHVSPEDRKTIKIKIYDNSDIQT